MAVCPDQPIKNVLGGYNRYICFNWLIGSVGVC